MESVLKLRPYQNEAVVSALDHLRENFSTLIVLPTGAGKTVVFTEIAKQWQTGKVLILAHREELVNQAAEKVFTATGEKPAIEMADQTSMYASSMFGGSSILVGSVQSVCQQRRLDRLVPSEFGLVIVDECFPAGTLVDGKPIERIRVGDTVTTFDERRNIFCKRTVTHRFINPAPFEMIKIRFGGRSVVSTLNHPFLTKRGWVEADRICVGDQIGVVHGGDSREGSEEGSVFAWARVDDITVHKRANQDGFNELCPDGFVYNLEVEGEHTYVANGCIVHNCHHCTPQNGSYHAIVEHFKQNAACKLLGVTATPDRSDRLALGQVFETVAYEMTILDAIDGGWLVPIEQQFVTVNGLDFSKVRTIAGDLSETDLESLMMQDGGRLLHEIASATVDASQDEPCLIFANSVGSAEMLAKIINRYPGKKAQCLHGKTPKEERRYWLGEYARGEFQFLVGCDLFLEGFDSPRISVVSNAKPTKSRSRYTQCVGRGTRTLPGCVQDWMTLDERLAAIRSSGKRRLLVLDFVGNSAQHKLISTADILAGRWAPAAVKDSGEQIDMRQAMANASKDLADEEVRRQQLEEKKRREDEERKEREWLRAQADYEATAVDPFGDTAVGGIRFGAGGKLKGPTPRMADLLRSNGVDPTGLSYQEAQEKISDLQQFWNGSLCSPKQSEKLKQYGENPRATRDQAKVILDVIAASGWRPRTFKFTRDRWSIGKGQDGKFYPIIRTDSGKVPVSAKFNGEQQCRDFISRVMEG